MDERSDAQVVEIFHLLLMQVLTAHSRDRFVLKGGANLRYFFGSVRYSNDIDLDFTGKESWRIEQTVDSALTGRALTMLLDLHGLSIGASSKPKQTETARRWKLGLIRSGVTDPLVRTKVEFSIRGVDRNDVLFETIPQHVVDPYAIRPATMSHYGLTAALEQKISALALRSETKARDVFDLELLFRHRRMRGETHGLAVRHAAQAREKALAISYASFRSEVIPFLEPGTAMLYDSEDEWERLRTIVGDEIELLIASEGVERSHEID
jgi:predicted nucleotidyltransferase component of viral defense system